MKTLGALIITFILNFYPTAQAKEIEIDWLETFVMVSVPGEVMHGDRLRFVMQKNNCDQAFILFSSYTYLKNPKILELVKKKVPVLVNGYQSEALAVSTSPFLMGHIVMFQLGKGSLEDLIPLLNATKNYQITITDNDDFKAAEYFDITNNNWDLSEIEPAITQANKLCIEKSKSKTNYLKMNS